MRLRLEIEKLVRTGFQLFGSRMDEFRLSSFRPKKAVVLFTWALISEFRLARMPLILGVWWEISKIILNESLVSPAQSSQSPTKRGFS